MFRKQKKTTHNFQWLLGSDKIGGKKNSLLNALYKHMLDHNMRFHVFELRLYHPSIHRTDLVWIKLLNENERERESKRIERILRNKFVMI